MFFIIGRIGKMDKVMSFKGQFQGQQNKVYKQLRPSEGQRPKILIMDKFTFGNCQRSWMNAGNTGIHTRWSPKGTSISSFKQELFLHHNSSHKPTHTHTHTNTHAHTHAAWEQEFFPLGTIINNCKMLHHQPAPAANQLPMAPSMAGQNGQRIIYISIVKNDDNEVNITLVLLKLKWCKCFMM